MVNTPNPIFNNNNEIKKCGEIQNVFKHTSQGALHWAVVIMSGMKKNLFKWDLHTGHFNCLSSESFSKVDVAAATRRALAEPQACLVFEVAYSNGEMEIQFFCLRTTVKCNYIPCVWLSSRWPLFQQNTSFPYTVYWQNIFESLSDYLYACEVRCWVRFPLLCISDMSTVLIVFFWR